MSIQYFCGTKPFPPTTYSLQSLQCLSNLSSITYVKYLSTPTYKQFSQNLSNIPENISPIVYVISFPVRSFQYLSNIEAPFLHLCLKAIAAFHSSMSSGRSLRVGCAIKSTSTFMATTVSFNWTKSL